MYGLSAGAQTVLVAVRLTGTPKKEAHMLYWTLVFLIISIIAGLLGFGVIAFAAAGIAKILFFLFLVLFVLSLVMHVGRRV